MIRIVFLVTIFLISDIKIFANNSVCEKIYSDCFYNIPKKMITYYKPYNKVGFVNKNSINLRDIPIINSKNSKIVLKLKKNDKIEIKKIFYLKNNTHVNLKLAPLSKILFAEPNPTPAKYALSLMGKCKADVREPLYELSTDTKKQLRKIIKDLNFI